MKDYFYCYSPRLQRAFHANGFKYICVGLNIKTGAVFWLYEATDELNDFKNRQYQADRDKY